MEDVVVKNLGILHAATTGFVIMYQMACLAQSGDNIPVTSYSNNPAPLVISRISGPVTLDGMSDEPAWEGIEPLPMIMQIPNFGQNPSERTQIIIAYDDEYLYAAARFYERDPSKIQSPYKKRDTIGSNSDWFILVIDTFNDNENALVFMTAPEALRTDFAVFNDAVGNAPFNTSWNTFWDAETVRNGDGWFIEIRIPLSSLRFQVEDGQVVMGLIASRWIARTPELAIFPAIPDKWGFWSFVKPSQARKVVLNGLSSRKPFYITPYFLGGIQQCHKLNDPETAYVREDDPDGAAGLDVKYGLSSNLTVDVTVNTDFAQVEADDQQVNLTRYSLFFPEKRLFFQERTPNFEFNFDGRNRLFHSRRIGIYEKKLVPIYGGVRIVGRVGPWDLGFLNMQTERFEGLPSENFGVLRIRRRVFGQNTYMGGIVTSRVGDDGTYNTAYGIDGIFRVFEDDNLRLNWAQTFENDRDNNPASLAPARIRVNWERPVYKGFAYEFDFSRAGEDYEPGMGYEQHSDYSRFSNLIKYGWFPGEKSSLLRHHVSLEGFMYLRNHDSSTESAEIGPKWAFTTKSNYKGTFSEKVYYEDLQEAFELSDDVHVPAGQYSFYGFEGELSTPSSRLANISTTLKAGSFYDGWRVSLGITPRMNVSSALEVRCKYRINRITFPDRDQRYTAHIGQFRVLAMRGIMHSVTANIQYNSAADLITTNIRYRYNPREGNDLYLVYNENNNTDRHREIPVLPVTRNRTIMVKYSYTFRL